MTLRSRNLARLDGETFDVLVIGGGINGAVSAAALSAQGVRVALIERGDFAGLTSQESSNLVWGGIKYLQTGELALVSKLCRSRNHLLRAYPSSIREIRFLVGLEPASRRSRLVLYLGTLLYWAIGRFATRPPRLLSARDLEREEPSIASPGGSVEYSDAHLVETDARFVFGFIRRALDHGASIANYVEARGARRTAEGVWHTTAHDLETGRGFEIRSRVLINACGPAVDDFNALASQKTRHRHVLSKGVHLIVDRATASRRVLTFFASDGRPFFILPLGFRSCIGTTDTQIDALPARVTDDDRRMILDNANRRLRLVRPLTEDDIISERCGARPLAIERGKPLHADWAALSRKHAIEVDHDSRYVAVFGGKITDCLNVGEEILDVVRALEATRPIPRLPWYGEPSRELRDAFLRRAKHMRLDVPRSEAASEELSARLWRRYGSSAHSLLDRIHDDPRMADVLIAGTEYIRAEAHHAAEHEMVVQLADLLRRRTEIALVARRRELEADPGLLEACRILFQDDSKCRFDAYFIERATPEAAWPRDPALR